MRPVSIVAALFAIALYNAAIVLTAPRESSSPKAAAERA